MARPSTEPGSWGKVAVADRGDGVFCADGRYRTLKNESKRVRGFGSTPEAARTAMLANAKKLDAGTPRRAPIVKRGSVTRESPRPANTPNRNSPSCSTFPARRSIANCAARSTRGSATGQDERARKDSGRAFLHRRCSVSPVDAVALRSRSSPFPRRLLMWAADSTTASAVSVAAASV
mgnify:CR=1 FL=1